MKNKLLTLLLAVSVFLSGCWQELPFEYKDNVLSVPLELRCYENAVLSIE